MSVDFQSGAGRAQSGRKDDAVEPDVGFGESTGKGGDVMEEKRDGEARDRAGPDVPDPVRRRLLRMTAYAVPLILTLGMTRKSHAGAVSPF